MRADNTQELEGTPHAGSTLAGVPLRVSGQEVTACRCFGFGVQALQA